MNVTDAAWIVTPPKYRVDWTEKSAEELAAEREMRDLIYQRYMRRVFAERREP